MAYKTRQTSKIGFAIYVGFFAGLIWGAVKFLAYGLKFTSSTPGFLIEPFVKHRFLATWPGMLLGWAAFIVFSIAAALLFTGFLRKVRGSWIGLAYGLVWWLLIYVIIGSLTGMSGSSLHLDRNSLVSDFCLFILWGLFIGYSIVFEYTNEQELEPEEAQKA